MLLLHRTQVFDTISRIGEGDMGHSILQRDMPDDEDYHLRAKQEEETSKLTTCVALVLPTHSLLASGATQICMNVLVLPVLRSADPSAPAARTPSEITQLRLAR